MSGKLLQKYYLRLKGEGFLRALLWGVAIGFGTLAVLGMLHWFMGWKSAWICLLACVAVSVCATFAFYHWKYKPTTKMIARRVDDLGLHERILTMTELEGDESYMAKRQREDALESLKTIRSELLPIRASVSSIITASVSVVLGVFGFLFASGVFKSYADVNPIPPLTYTITYGVKDSKGGTVNGTLQQTVAVGEMTEAVIAVPQDGWRFEKWTIEESGKWSEEYGRPYRTDEVFADKTYLAVFVEVDLGKINGLPEDTPADAPGTGGGQQESNSNSNDENHNEQNGEHEEVNNIIDGETFYGDQYDEAYKDAMENLADEKYTGDQKEIANGYFDNIEKDEQEDEEDNN